MKSRSNSSGFVVTLERLRHLRAEPLSGTTTRGADFELRAWLIRVLNIDVNLDWGIQLAPLIQATNEERFDRVQFLCALGADVKVTQLRGCTCLHSAAFSGRVDMMRFFVRMGADPCALDDTFETPLDWAVEGGHVGAVEFLHRECGADLFAPSFSDPSTTLLHCAALSSSAAVVRYLVEAGMSTNMDTQDGDGCTPLHCSVAYPGVVRYLLQVGAGTSIRDDLGRSPAHLAACDDNVHSLGMLLQANAAINDAVDLRGLTPFAVAAMNRQLMATRRLHATLGDSLDW